ncbi:MAG: endonuclease MutS2 [Helicobacteraceae bacterium]|jgi:DNA mismatch repair protein MutS2|nr:endonuclease MutS2 [Helicobacteraceae bacterium]
MSLDSLIDRLDLTGHIDSFNAFFSRPKKLFIEGDQERHFNYIEALDKLTFRSPPKVTEFQPITSHLKKQGVLRFEQIFEVIKVVRYFRTLKNSTYDGIIGEWMHKIQIPERFSDEVESYFDLEGRFNEELDEELFGLSLRIKVIKDEINASMRRLLHNAKVSPYLVDTQIHYVNEEECLLVRGGFNHVMKGHVAGRTSGGFFYVVPDAMAKNRDQIKSIQTMREVKFYEYAKTFSKALVELLPFIAFIDKEFERFDHYQARLHFARAKDLAIIKAQKNREIKLADFEHPALHKPKPVSVDFSKSVLMITGVNAGGKTMLLKAILSAALMAKYLIPMKLNKHKSVIGNFKRFEAIIDDPQNVKNDISTFAGRMQQFSHLFSQHDALVGVDEIELGTDSDEAAALFKVILDDLIAKGQKIVVTTHHKRLAALMADRDDVELMAAIYDEEHRQPTYEFLQGIIGKSYAFETALRYGIMNSVVERAKTVYGENHEKLNELIERGAELERELKVKQALLDEKLTTVESRERDLKAQKEELNHILQEERSKLKMSYASSIEKAKEAARQSDTKSIHKKMNEANRALPQEELPKQEMHYEFKIGDPVKYRKSRGTLINLKAKEAMIEVEGMRLRVKRDELRPSGNVLKKKTKTDVTHKIERRSGLKLDLHGLRAEEAEEKMDKFLSDALIDGWDEVIIYHGIGTGKLSYAVKNFLTAHPKVNSFEDAPQHMGGFGAKIVRL